jgi:hypothetical protein
MTMSDDLRYPIGRFQWTGASTPDDRSRWIQIIAATPATLRDAVAGLNALQLDTPYRDGGWTVRQVVHHYADDHMNSYMRFKLALTEEAPLIKAYSESSWAELPDARTGPVEPSLQILTSLHQRWVMAWESLKEADWQRTFVHAARGAVPLDHLAALYAWHGVHHVTQVLRLRDRSGWNRQG